MKIVRQLLLVLPFIFLSCSEEDNSSTPDDENGNGNGSQETVVRYALTSTSDIVSTVQYRVASGVYDTDSDVGANWSTEVEIPKPFNASMFVQFSNTSAAAQQYTLQIFVDDELEYSKQGSVAASASISDSATHTVIKD